MFTPTITKDDLQEGDLLFYRGNSIFSFIIRIGEVIRYGRWKHFFTSFTHVAQIVYNRELDTLQRYDAMEGFKTGFRNSIGKAYVFRFKEHLTARELMVWRNYLLARNGSDYDLKGAVSTIGRQRDDVFGDFCSELTKNALFSIRKIKDKPVTPYGLYILLRKKLDFVGVII